MMRVAALTRGMRVLLPTGAIARVEGQYVNSQDCFVRVVLTTLDPALATEPLQAKLLRPYLGPPVVFTDEAEQLRYKHHDRPLAVRPSGPDE